MERLVMWGLRVMGTRSRGHAVHETPGLKRALFYFYRQIRKFR